MQALPNDMPDFNRTKLGLEISISPTDAHLEKLFSDELDSLRAAHPDRRVDLDAEGDCRGVWDGPRRQQLLGNLVLNVIRYGAPDSRVRVVITGEEGNVRFEVRNPGPVIDRLTLHRIFDPLQRGLNHADSSNADGNVGPGLYVAREIGRAHKGEFEAWSDEAETVFAVRLPRRQ